MAFPVRRHIIRLTKRHPKFHVCFLLASKITISRRI
ncbi:hypothetical protein HFW55_000024 [Salmonella enterica]|nr:hypothetical protein [Salmonella enterica subsp. enterica serovar Newport]